METGLEVEAAKVVVLQQVGKLASNMSRLEHSLQKTDNDVDYLYKELYEVNCGCTELKATVARLEASVANVSALANENRLALESNADMEERGRGEDWEPMVTTLQQEVQQVKRHAQTHTPGDSIKSSYCHHSIKLCKIGHGVPSHFMLNLNVLSHTMASLIMLSLTTLKCSMLCLAL